MWEAISAIDEAVWTAEYAGLVIGSHTRRPLPRSTQRIGATVIDWYEPIPGRYHILVSGGTVDDRQLARAIVGGELDAYGLRPVSFTVGGAELRKTADWNEVQQKAIRLMDDGNVQILRNAPDVVVGHVIGDHGEYQTEISRQDPNSNVIDHWTCECPWDQFAWQRTRQWKSLEGRPCAHVLATHWYSQKMPLDQEFDPTTGQPITPDTAHGQMGLSVPWGTPPAPSGGAGAPMPAGAPTDPSQQLSIPGIDPGMATATPPMPPSPNILPQMPQPPMPVPVSVPGAKIPDATNPMQWPGGTFSKVANDDWDFDEEYDGHKYIWDHDNEEGVLHNMKDGMIYHHDLAGMVNGETLSGGSVTPEGIIDVAWYGTNEAEPPAMINWLKGRGFRMPNNPEEAAYADQHGYKIAATNDTFQNSDMVRINKDEYGTAEGKSEEHGAGEWRTIKKNSIGEVLGQDPTTGWVDCIFPLHDSGPMEPYHIRAWIEPANLSPMPNIKKPGPFIQRKR